MGRMLFLEGFVGDRFHLEVSKKRSWKSEVSQKKNQKK